MRIRERVRMAVACLRGETVVYNARIQAWQGVLRIRSKDYSGPNIVRCDFDLHCPHHLIIGEIVDAPMPPWADRGPDWIGVQHGSSTEIDWTENPPL